jgi:hypothetical protein
VQSRHGSAVCAKRSNAADSAPLQRRHRAKGALERAHGGFPVDVAHQQVVGQLIQERVRRVEDAVLDSHVAAAVRASCATVGWRRPG